MKDLTRRNFLFGSLAAAGMTLAACSNNQGGGDAAPADDGGEAPADGGEAAGGDKPLVVGYSYFSSKFSPFFAETAYDQDAQSMTQVALYPTTRLGEVVYKGIEGETYPYNGTDYTYYGPADVEVTENADGTVYYDITLRDDITFSDGTPMTIDDYLFSAYVRCDPTYDGSATLFSMPIAGMDAYRSGMDSLYNLIVAAGPDNTDFTYWTEEQQKAYWDTADAASHAIAQEIVDYLIAAGVNTAEDDLSKVVPNWGFELPEGATIDDFAKLLMDSYGNDVVTMINTENAGSTVESLFPDYPQYQVGIETGESAPNISGIEKTGDYSCRVTATQVDANLIYQLGFEISPASYYGNVAVDVANNVFGFSKGDLSPVRAQISNPMGAGAYKFVKFENGVINYEAFDNFFKGAPKTKYVQFREMSDVDKLNGVVTGTVDVTDPSWSKDTATAVAKENGGDITGSVITTSTVDNLGYGYIGMNSHNVAVGGVPDSDASKNLRKAMATIFSVYRDVAIDSYYGEAAEVINYPISNTSWAAPHATDPDYKVAFSVDVNGNDIYTSDMDAEAKYAAAKAAALGFFEAAGYTVADGKLTAAPDGAKLEYEVMVPGDGTGDHPAFMILTEAKNAFAEIGMNLIINDLTNSSDLWTALEAQQGEIWCAAWGATIDPDMTQVYYSDIANGGANPGGSNYMYQIEDPELDQLILDARASTDQEYRKQMYKACLDIVIDWACEIPTYQRQNAIIFSTERVNMATVTPDITTFYDWKAEIENIEMN